MDDYTKNWWHYFKLPNGVEIKREDAQKLELPHYPENLWAMVEPYVEGLKDKRALDIGSNSGWFTIKLCKLGAWVIGVDNCQANSGDRVGQGNFVADRLLSIEQKNKILFIKDDFINLPYSSEFEAVWFFGVYYHLPDHLKALPKINKMMKTGGILYLESAVADKYRDLVAENWCDKTSFFVPTIDYLRKDLEKNKFTIVAEKDVSRPNVGKRYFFKAVKNG